MAEKPKSLLEGGPADALGRGAARFDQLIESVKAQYAAPAEAAAPPASNPLLHVSPGEAWSRNFQSQAIGPNAAGIALSELASVPRAVLVPAAADIVPGRAAEIAPRTVGAASLSVQLGRPEKLAERPRRSWLGRLFGQT